MMMKKSKKGVYRNFLYNNNQGDSEIESEYNTEFYRYIHDHYQISDSYYMPVVRNIPVFPDKAVEIGE